MVKAGGSQTRRAADGGIPRAPAAQGGAPRSRRRSTGEAAGSPQKAGLLRSQEEAQPPGSCARYRTICLVLLRVAMLFCLPGILLRETGGACGLCVHPIKFVRLICQMGTSAVQGAPQLQPQL